MPSGGVELYQLLLKRFTNGTLQYQYYDRMRSFLNDDDYSPKSDDSNIWNTMGNTFFQEKDFIHALQCYENAIEIDHNNKDSCYNLGLTLKILGRTDA
jgi:tetratricopeptide (TPR) repeat protein